MIDKSTISNPRTHYGNGKHATRAFLVQRISGAVLIAMTAFLAWFVLSLAGADRASMAALVANPVVAILLVVLVVATAAHMRIGMQEVIEDYFASESRHKLATLANFAFTGLVALVAIGSVIKIVFWG